MLDMDRFQRGSGGSAGISRSLRREKSHHRSPGGSNMVSLDLRPRGGVVGDLLLPSDAARGEGNIQMGKQVNALKVESDGKAKIPTQYDMRGPLKSSGTPVKVLMEKEMQKQVESRRHSPSVIAKLMGLDSLPAQQPCSIQKKESVVSVHKRSSEGFLEKGISYEEREQEFKDIFEVLETRAAEKPNWHATKGLLNSRRRDKDMAAVQQKYMNAKLFSIDEKLQTSEEFSEALEALEPTSLFEKHLRDFHSVPATPEARHITVLKSSNGAKQKNSDISQKSWRKKERNTVKPRNSMHKPETDIFIHCLKEHTIPRSREPSKSKVEGNTEASSLPTRIVVLKPSLEKVQKSAGRQGMPENCQLHNSGYRRQREFRRSGRLELFSELRERKAFSDDVEVAHRMKGSREKAKEIAKHMKHTVNGDRVKSYGSRDNIFPGHGNLHRTPDASIHIDVEAERQTSCHADSWNKSHSSSCLTKTFTSREARKHLSERWMMTHEFQVVGLTGHGLSTLGEMLALSDKETPDAHLHSLSCQEGSRVKVSGKEVLAKWSPSGISSRDGWKDGCSSGLPRSKSLPTSSSIYGNTNSLDIHDTGHIDNPFMLKDVLKLGPRKFSMENSFSHRCVAPCRDVKLCSNTSQPCDGDEEENKFPVMQIHVDQNKLLHGLSSKNSPVEKFDLLEYSACDISDTTSPDHYMPVVRGVGVELPCLTVEQKLSQSLGFGSPTTDECSSNNHGKETVAKETLNNQHEAESRLSHTCATEQLCSMIDEEVEQPSPISVLEPPDENGCSPESFERVNADLQELRMQLKLLKLESRDTYADRYAVSNEDAGGETIDVLSLGGGSQAVESEEDRDFSYMLNVLRDSGFHTADWDMVFSAFFSPGSPVSPDVFEKLEKFYSGVTWSRSERKLLFDTINSVLADVLALNMDLHPWVRPRRDRLIGWKKNLPEEVWQSLVRRRMELASDASGKFMDSVIRFDLSDDLDFIGREVERMLKDDLLEELVMEIVSL